MPNFCLRFKKIARVLPLTTLLTAVALKPSLTPRAQRQKEPPVSVSEISTRRTASGRVVTLSADVPMTRAQTWQDPEGYHVVLPPQSSIPGSLPRGMKARQVGRSLELLVPVSPGATVTVQPQLNRLNLIVDGDVETSQDGTDSSTRLQTSHRVRRGEASNAAPSSHRSPRRRRGPTNNAPVAPAISNSPASSSRTHSSSKPAASKAVSRVPPAQAAAAKAAPLGTPQAPEAPILVSPTTIVPQVPAAAPVNPPVNSPAALEQEQTGEEGGILSFIFSAAGIAIFTALGLISLLVVRHRRRHSSGETAEVKNEGENGQATATMPSVFERRAGSERRKSGRPGGRRGSDKFRNLPTAGTPPSAPAEKREQALQARQPVNAPAAPIALFGAYRVDQEVSKLVLGQPHRMDVLASRAADDRRAIEASLIKAMSAPGLDEDTRRRARVALEDYGFVARQSAALLMAPDAFARASAARMLGDIGAPSALPFMLEALYDPEAIVRTQAVESLGALKLPSAIGALLDMARRHPDIPAALISRALNACSFDCLDTGGLHPPAGLPVGFDAAWTGDIVQLEPVASVEALPDWLEDESLTEALERLESTDVEARTAAARQLAQFQARCSVAALTAMAADDPEPAVRAAAVVSLGEIEHESVFAPVLIALADDSREVRAAAARSLSRLNFDRADAYVRVMEMADDETLRDVARSCIKAGVAAQAVDRLASEDRRQAYEAFSLLSLLAKSNEVGPIIEAITGHHDLNVRAAAIRLLGLSGRPEIVQHLRPLAVRDDLPETLRTALLEVVYKLDQAQYA